MNHRNEGTALSRKILWAIVSAVIAVCTIGAVVRESGNVTPASLWALIKNSNPFFLALAFLGMLGYVYFEGAALRCIVNRTEAGAGVTQRHAFLYAAADIYFSAITPSASGGQPASLYFMKKDGLPISLSSAALIFNLAMYNAAIVLIGVFSILCFPSMFLRFSLLGKVLIIIGYVLLIGLMALFLLLLRKGTWVHSLGTGLLNLLGRLHLLRDPSRTEKRLARTVRNYKECALLFLKDKALLRNAFLYNLAQRASQIAVSSCVFVCIGGDPRMFFQIFALQSLAVIGSNCIPVPGGMGVADYLMLTGFSLVMTRHDAVTLELLSRGISFYFCVFLCLAIVILVSLYKRKHPETNLRQRGE